jgi:hypothetical protein
MRSASHQSRAAVALIGLLQAISVSLVAAGPYSAALNDPANAHDAPVPGFLGPHGIGKARLITGLDANNQPIYQNPENHSNPIFFAWGETVTDYLRSDSQLPFSDGSLALGPVTGDNFDVVALGDLNASALAAGDPPGTITLELSRAVRNLSGSDFVVFENGTISQGNEFGEGIGGIFGELAYVEVSANGVDFVRFPSASLTTGAVGGFSSINPTNVRNLAGKHVNAYGDSWGTPFDLAEVNLPEITHIRLVDIPGNGSFLDTAGNPIRDPWTTFGSGGFDLEAVGAISTSMTFGDWPQLADLSPADQTSEADPDHDGLSNLLEYAFAKVPTISDAAPTGVGISGGSAEIHLVRDERLTDVIYEVQASSSMAAEDWITIAHSVSGQPFAGVNGYFPVISESSASAIQSIGVIRACTVRDIIPIAADSRRFLRVKVSLQADSIAIE